MKITEIFCSLLNGKYTGANKGPPGRDFLRQISTVFGTFLKKYLRYRTFIYLIGKP